MGPVANMRDNAIMKFINLTAAISMAAFVTACASQPEPEEYVEVPDEVDSGPEIVQDTGPIPGSEADFIESAGDRVFFGLDRYDLSNEARAVLREQAAWLSAFPGTRVLVAGNADERGTREYNLALGQRRAQAAAQYLISQGVDASRISLTSYGKERPTCNESTERCWAVNRNSTTVITSGANS